MPSRRALILCATIVLVAVGAVLFSRLRPDQSQCKERLQSVDATWKLYCNERLGVTLSYPPDTTLRSIAEIGVPIPWTPNNDFDEILDERSGEVLFGVNQTSGELSEQRIRSQFGYSGPLTLSSTTIDGFPALRFEFPEEEVAPITWYHVRTSDARLIVIDVLRTDPRAAAILESLRFLK